MRFFLIACATMALTLQSGVLAAGLEDVPIPPVRIRYGAGNPVCRDAAAIVARTPLDDYENGHWRARFGPLTWEQGVFETMGSYGLSTLSYDYQSIDIDNDGGDEIVFRSTGSMGAFYYDWIYVFPPVQFWQAQRDGTMPALMNRGPILNMMNQVNFSNGSHAIPGAVETWRRGNVNYLVMVEAFFNRARHPMPQPSGFFVARLTRKSVRLDPREPMPRLVPELVCRMVLDFKR
jgi:hypothetical protein